MEPFAYLLPVNRSTEAFGIESVAGLFSSSTTIIPSPPFPDRGTQRRLGDAWAAGAILGITVAQLAGLLQPHRRHYERYADAVRKEARGLD